VDLTKELDGPNLLMNTMILSKENLMEQLNTLKFAWKNEFIETIDFSKEEVKKWSVQYININDEVDDTLHQPEMDLSVGFSFGPRL